MHLEEHSLCFMHWFGIKTLSGALLGPVFKKSGYGARYLVCWCSNSAGCADPTPPEEMAAYAAWCDAHADLSTAHCGGGACTTTQHKEDCFQDWWSK